MRRTQTDADCATERGRILKPIPFFELSPIGSEQANQAFRLSIMFEMNRGSIQIEQGVCLRVAFRLRSGPANKMDRHGE